MEIFKYNANFMQIFKYYANFMQIFLEIGVVCSPGRGSAPGDRHCVRISWPFCLPWRVRVWDWPNRWPHPDSPGSRAVAWTGRSSSWPRWRDWRPSRPGAAPVQCPLGPESLPAAGGGTRAAATRNAAPAGSASACDVAASTGHTPAAVGSRRWWPQTAGTWTSTSWTKNLHIQMKSKGRDSKIYPKRLVAWSKFRTYSAYILRNGAKLTKMSPIRRCSGPWSSTSHWRMRSSSCGNRKSWCNLNSDLMLENICGISSWLNMLCTRFSWSTRNWNTWNKVNKIH